MAKKIITTTILFLNILIFEKSIAQNNQIRYNFLQCLSIEASRSGINGVLFSKYKDSFYIIYKSPKSNSTQELTLCTIKDLSKPILDYSGTIYLDSVQASDVLMDFCVVDSNLILLSTNSLVSYKLKGDKYYNSYSMKNLSTNKCYITSIGGLSNGNCVGFGYYNDIGLDNNIHVYKIIPNNNLLTFTIDESWEITTKYPLFTHRINKFIDYNDNGDVVFAESLPYQIKQLNVLTGRLDSIFVDSLTVSDNAFIDSLSRVNSYYHKGVKDGLLKTVPIKDLIYAIMDNDQQKFTRIEKLFFVNNDILIQRRGIQLEENHRLYDLWKNKNGNIVPFIISQQLQDTQLYEAEKNNVFRNLPAMSTSTPMIVINNKLLVLTGIHLPDEIAYDNVSWTEFSKQLDDYYDAKTIPMGINIYDIEY